MTTEVINGTITSNLFDAVAKIGEKDELAMNLAEIFAWDIDFMLDRITSYNVCYTKLLR